MAVINSIADLRELTRRRLPRALFDYIDRGSYDAEKAYAIVVGTDGKVTYTDRAPNPSDAHGAIRTECERTSTSWSCASG